MKVLQVHERYSPYGGGEVYFRDMCHGLAEKGHEVICVYTSNHYSTSTKDSKLKEYCVKPSIGWRSGRRAVAQVIEIVTIENPDIIHLHGIHYGVSPLVVRALRRLRPIVYTAHEISNFCYKNTKLLFASNRICEYPLDWNCLRRGCFTLRNEGRPLDNLRTMFLLNWRLREYRKLDRIIAPSRYARQELLRNDFVPDKTVTLNHYLPICPEWDKPRETSLREDMILYVGRMYEKKGVMEFLEVLNLIANHPWKAVFIGEGPDLEKAIQRAKKLHLSNRTEFVGGISRGDLEHYYSRCSLLVIPSLCPESFGLVGLEAMYFSKPVVAFDLGGVKDLVVDGKTGFLVEGGDTKGMATSIVRLLENKELVAQFGEAGKKRFIKLFQKKRHIQRLLQILQEVIEERKG